MNRSLLGSTLLGALLFLGCDGWDPARPFERNAPDVDKAIAAMQSGKYDSAEQLLGEYLGTGVCDEDGIGLPDRIRQRPDGTFDLGLTLFHLAEEFGQKFGEEEELPDGEEPPPPTEADKQRLQEREIRIQCALLVVKAVAQDPKVDPALRARAHYLAGNLEFMRDRFHEAVREYSRSLQLVPGVDESAGGDAVGRKAAWNRAVALRRIEEEEKKRQEEQEKEEEEKEEEQEQDQEEQEQDKGGDDQEEQDEGGGDQEQEQDKGGDDQEEQDQGGGDQEEEQDQGEGDQEEQDQGGGDQEEQDQNQDQGGQDEQDGQGNQGPPQQQPSGGGNDSQPEEGEGSTADQDERLLDEFEGAPTYQEEEARRRAGRRQPRGMEDK